jgi:RNA-binding protein
MNNKQRAYLSGLASKMAPVFNIGKASLTPEVVQAVDEALEKRELIKVAVLKNCFDDPKAIAQTLAERTHAQVVRVIGKKIILYRASKKPQIELPE